MAAGFQGGVSMRIWVCLTGVLGIALSGCDSSSATQRAGAEAKAAGPAPLLISPEDLLTVRPNPLASGPPITGSVQPARRADLRAEVSAVVLRVLKENGDVVKRGELIVRLDDTAIRDSLTSAEASARAAKQAFEQAERQFQRLSKLSASGVVAAQEVEDAEVRRNNSQSDLEAARTQLVLARQQLQRTEARAPFDGIVSDRKVSAGDTAQIGKELVKVIDPASMRFEGLVSADHIGEVEPGQPVLFRVHGYVDQPFSGNVARVNPSADATTRQVEVLVAFADPTRQPRLAGLYGEGHIETATAAALTVPESALVRDGDRAFAWRVDGKAIRKVGVKVGEAEPRTGEIVLQSGLSAGDAVLRYPTSALHDGQKVELAGAAAPASLR
jgi:membrane fusion protein (multidrug efflux system)